MKGVTHAGLLKVWHMAVPHALMKLMVPTSFYSTEQLGDVGEVNLLVALDHLDQLPTTTPPSANTSCLKKRIFIELMTSDHKLEVSREGSK